MTRLPGQLFYAFLALAVSAVALAQPGSEASRWLERMASAMSSMSYQGTFIYMKGDEVETMRITRVVDGNDIRERLYSVDGPQREIIRDDKGVRCVLADEGAIVQDPFVAGTIYPLAPYHDLVRDDSPYKLETGGRARLAGQHARLVSITPLDGYRYGYDFWLEENTGLLLKWVLFDDRRKPLAKLMFTSLRLGNAIDRGELYSNTPSDEFVLLSTPMPAQPLKRAQPKWKPQSLPRGFRLTAHNIVESGGEDVFEHLVYSDGLASVSVYIEDLEADSVADDHGASQLGTANAYSRHVGSKHVTVIGEVPQVTVRSIGTAVAPASN